MTTNGVSPIDKIIITLLLSTFTVIGTIGNLFICIFFKRRTIVRRQIYESTCYLIKILAFVDMLKSMDNVIYILNLNEANLNSNFALCQWSGFANIGIVGASVWLIAVISINRACVVTNHANIFTRKRTLMYIGGVLLSSLIAGIAPVLGWSEYHNQKSRLVCTITYREPKSYSTFHHIIFEVIPGFAIGISTFIILKVKRRHLRRVIAADTNNRDARLRQDSKQTVMLLVVIFAFILCFLPDFILERIRKGKPPSVTLDLLSTTFRSLNHAINPIIYGLFNRSFRNSLLTKLRLLFEW